MKTIMKAIYTIKNFAKRTAMVITTMMMVLDAWSLTSSQISSTAATSITDGGLYVVGTAYTTNLLNGAWHNSNWGYCTNTLNEAIIFTAHGSTSSFYLTSSVCGTIVSATGNFPIYNNGTTENLSLGGSGQIQNKSSNTYLLRFNSTGARWYNSNTGSIMYLYKVTLPTYTVTYNAGSGTCATTSNTEASGGAGVPLPSASPSAACASAGWVFAGWKQTSAQTETTSIPTLYAAGSTYYPTASETLYAVYRLGDVYTIDFENTLGSYSDWSFNQISSQQSTIHTHGGSYYGTTTGGSVTITTTDKITAPKAIRFYISKESGNTTASTWTVQTSSDGSTWDDRKSESAVGMYAPRWLEVTQDLSSYTNVYVRISYGSSTAIRAIDDVLLSCATYNSNPSCCADVVTLSVGSVTDGTMLLGAASVATCGADNTRQVTISVTPTTQTGFDAPATLDWTQTSGSTFTAPTLVSGPTLNGGAYDYVYQFPQNVSGSGTFGATCIALTNYRTSCCTDPQLSWGTIASPVTEYVITRQDLASATDYGTVTIAEESNSPATIEWIETVRPATPCLGQAIWRAGSGNDQSPTGQFYVDMANNLIKSKTSGVYIVTIKQDEDNSTGTDYCAVEANVTVRVKTIDKFIDAVNGNFSGEPQNLEDTGCGILLPTETTFSTNDGCADGVVRRLIGWIKASDLFSTTPAVNSYLYQGSTSKIDTWKTADPATNKVIAPGTRVTATGITWYAVWGTEVTP